MKLPVAIPKDLLAELQSQRGEANSERIEMFDKTWECGTLVFEKVIAGLSSGNYVGHMVFRVATGGESLNQNFDLLEIFTTNTE
jgi:hypothetical protein